MSMWTRSQPLQLSVAGGSTRALGFSRLRQPARLHTVVLARASQSQPQQQQQSELSVKDRTKEELHFQPDSAEQEASKAASKHRLNIIPKSRWPKGIPPVMGAHLMPSGDVAPISVSKGAGLGGTPHLFAYPSKDSEAEVIQFGSADTGAQGLCAHVAELSQQAIAEKGSFTLVISGGSLFKSLNPLASLPGLDFSKWHVLFVDERNVPHSSPDSNYKGAMEAFLGKVPIPKDQIYAIAEGLSVDDAATEYAGQMLRMDPKVLPRTPSGFPILDLILLGIGPDGHIASLFPNHKELSAKEGWVLPVPNSPKPPPERITMTLPVINAAKAVDVVAFGAGKAEIVQRILEVQSLPGALPAQLVRPDSGKLRWLLDADSSARLSVLKWQDSKEFPRSS